MGSHRLPARSGERRDADIAHAPVARRTAFHLSEEASKPVRVGRVLAHPAGRQRTRPSSQRVHLDAAVVRERRETGRTGHGHGLGERRFPVPGTGFLEDAVKADLLEGLQAERPRREKKAQFADLSRIAGAEEQDSVSVHLAPLSTSSCSAKSRSRPAPASPRSASSSPRENGSCSAEPCSSMNRPSRDPTQFMSVSAAEFLEVAEVEPRLAGHDARTDGGHRPAQRIGADHVRLTKPFDRQGEGHVAARDGRGSGSAVGNDDVAVDQDAALAERLEVDGCPQAPADEPLNLLDPTIHAPLAAVALRAGLRAPRQHCVLGGHPPTTAALAKRRDSLLHRRRAENARVPHRDQRAALRVWERVQFDRGRSEFIGGTLIWAHWAECIGRPDRQRRKIRCRTMIEAS